MKINNVFPPTEPHFQFREQLKLEVLEVYNQQRQRRFHWRWLVAPSVVLVSFLLAVLVGNGQPFSQLPIAEKPTPSGIAQTSIPTHSSPLPQQTKDPQAIEQNVQPTQLATATQNLDELDRELAELSYSLSTDTDLESAIAFNNL